MEYATTIANLPYSHILTKVPALKQIEHTTQEYCTLHQSQTCFMGTIIVYLMSLQGQHVTASMYISLGYRYLKRKKRTWYVFILVERAGIISKLQSFR